MVDSYRAKLQSKWDLDHTRKGVNYLNYQDALPANGSDTAQVVDLEEFYSTTAVDIPIRPVWKHSWSADEINESEEKYFAGWLNHVFNTVPANSLGYFEQNLEVWRQLWRVCEMSDLLIVAVDARFPVLHFPISLYNFLTNVSQKKFVVAFTKCDLVARRFIELWKDKLEEIFPAIRTVEVSVPPGSLKGARREISECLADNLLKLIEEFKAEANPDRKYITVGTIGHPNVGKSSLINALAGKKVVSTSSTAGHTKHFQTIYIRDDIRLCDCPGLIFPMAVNKDVQILNGLYNVAQLRDPFGPIVLACRIVGATKMVEALKLHYIFPEDFTVIDLCERFAISRGFYTSKAGRPDINRSANFILRSLIQGNIITISWIPKSAVTELEKSFDSLNV